MYNQNVFDQALIYVNLYQHAKQAVSLICSGDMVDLNILQSNIWISKMLKFDYLKKEKSFPSEIKSIFPCFESALFQTHKTN